MEQMQLFPNRIKCRNVVKTEMKLRVPKETEIFFKCRPVKRYSRKKKKFAPRSYISIKSPVVTNLGESQYVLLV